MALTVIKSTIKLGFNGLIRSVVEMIDVNGKLLHYNALVLAFM